jgi:DNA-binding transcriptional MerR regulator
MRIAELSERTGVPVATIKYYLREGLLPAGELTSPNQARYDETHVRRVRLVRALVEVGGLSIATTREVLAKMHAPGRSTLDSVGKAQFAVMTRGSSREDEARVAAVERVAELIERHGWHVRPTNPARAALADVLAYLTRLDLNDMLEMVDDYAAAADRLAAKELDALARRPGVDSMAEAAVTMTVLGDALLAALRRLAQESAATQRLADRQAR